LRVSYIHQFYFAVPCFQIGSFGLWLLISCSIYQKYMRI